jgi:hypothetical protein
MSGAIDLSAESVPPGTARVSFFDGPVKLGEKLPTDGGYNLEPEYTAAQNGIRALTARAYDGEGGFVTSDPVTLTVDIRWTWVRQFPHDARAVASDGEGAVYAVGKTKPTASDAAITKFNSDGATIWTRSFGDENAELAHSVDVDAAGHAYVGGEVYVYGANPDKHVLLLKYDPAGNLLWNRHVDFDETVATDEGGYIAVDASGGVFLAGWAFPGKAVLQKYTGEGALLWSRQFSTGNAADVAVDSAGGVYVVGNGILEGYETEGLLVVKYDSDGSRLWGRQLEGLTSNVAHGAAALPSGGVCIAGTNRGGLGGGPATAWTDPFVVCYDAAGVLMWTRQLDIPWGHGSAVAIDSSSVYVIGTVHGLAFVAGEPTKGYGDAFLARHDHDGRFLSIHLLTSENGTVGSYEQGESAAVESDGTVYVSGGTDSTLAPGSSCPCSAGAFDGFLAKHKED